MSQEPMLSGLAPTAQTRPAGRWRLDEPDAATAAAPSAVPTAAEVYERAMQTDLLKRIRAKHSGGRVPGHEANDVHHARRYLTSLKWVPYRSGRILDPAPGGGLFPELAERYCECRVDVPDRYYDLEREPLPYADATFDGAVLMEVLEHFTVDPMFALGELNRVVKPDGFLFLTTPNLASWASLHNLINYHSPYIFGGFERHHSSNRHNREYTILEVGRLAEAAGFRVVQLEGIGVYPGFDAIGPIPGISPHNRGDTTFLLARKSGPVADRYPAWLYMDWAGA